MPSSTTPSRCVWRRRNSVRGTPMSLLRLPRVASTSSSAADLEAARRMDAIICVTVVLPLLPVTAISGKANWLRHCCANCPRARLASGTSTPGSPACCKPCSARAATAPMLLTCGRKSWASKRSPRRATNRSPACRLRVSVCTRRMFSGRAPTTLALGNCASKPASPGMGRGACAVVIGVLMPSPLRCAGTGPFAPAPCRKTAA